MSPQFEFTLLLPETPLLFSEASPHSLDGRIQRIDYGTGEVTVVAAGRLWSLWVTADSQLWFQGKAAPLRCFHPLDRVHVALDDDDDGYRKVRALYVWEFFP